MSLALFPAIRLSRKAQYLHKRRHDGPVFHADIRHPPGMRRPDYLDHLFHQIFPHSPTPRDITDAQRIQRALSAAQGDPYGT